MNFFLLNTDKRLNYLHNFLKNKKVSSEILTFEQIILKAKSEDIIIFPPNFKWNETIAKSLPNQTIVISGNATEQIMEIFKAKKIKYFNLMEDETFVLKNAILTAEGFLLDLILNTTQSIYEQRILILGGGRVAKAVANIFYKMGINFDITMRNDKKLIDFQLLTPNIVYWKDFKNKFKNYDVIINTIPFEIFDKNDIKKFNKNCTIFELSSIKCLNQESLNEFNIINPTQKEKQNLNLSKKFVFCPGIPGRYIPETSGKLILDYLTSKNIIK